MFLNTLVNDSINTVQENESEGDEDRHGEDSDELPKVDNNGQGEGEEEGHHGEAAEDGTEEDLARDVVDEDGARGVDEMAKGGDGNYPEEEEEEETDEVDDEDPGSQRIVEKLWVHIWQRRRQVCAVCCHPSLQ